MSKKGDDKKRGGRGRPSDDDDSSFLDEIFALLETATALHGDNEGGNGSGGKEKGGGDNNGGDENDDGEGANCRIEAATKYYEAVYLMRRYMERLPQRSDDNDNNDNNSAAMKRLLTEKCSHYERLAAGLMADDSSSTAAAGTSSARKGDPRSPIGSRTFFHADSGVVPPGAPAVVASEPTPPVPPSGAAAVVEINALTNRANAKLSAALDRDEGGTASTDERCAAYVEAAELYLQALQRHDGMNERNNSNNSNSNNNNDMLGKLLKRRLEQTLDRVEQIKMNSNSKYNKQPQPARRSSNVIVSERRLRDHQQQQQCAVGVAATAGQQRTSSKSPPRSVGSTSPPRRGPSQLSTEEIGILKRSSLMASGLFLPWSDDDTVGLLQPSDGNKSLLYTDPDGFLALSTKQRERFDRWARPSQIVQLRSDIYHRRERQKLCMIRPGNNSISPRNIKQAYVTDCSFISSLCCTAALERKFHKSLITSILYPQTVQAGSDRKRPVYNPTGKYMVKLWLNGVARCIAIDDYLPVDRYGNLLCSHTTGTDHGTHLELYVCLIEKAYMKLNGGYDFPGSNSGIDLFALTGWIPERILFCPDPDRGVVQDFEILPERAWERIVSASSFGDCLITVSSHLDLHADDADAIGLVTGHAYAVLSVVQCSTTTQDGENNIRLLQLKNPWAHKSWRGRYSRHDERGWSNTQLCRELFGRDHYVATTAATSNKDNGDGGDDDDGIFWICWDDILRYFKNFHLSWNPNLFSCCCTLHGYWPKDQGPADDTFNVGDNPQYVVSFSKKPVRKGATIWILLSRHVTKQEQEGVEVRVFAGPAVAVVYNFVLFFFCFGIGSDRIGRLNVVVLAFSNTPSSIGHSPFAYSRRRTF